MLVAQWLVSSCFSLALLNSPLSMPLYAEAAPVPGVEAPVIQPAGFEQNEAEEKSGVIYSHHFIMDVF